MKLRNRITFSALISLLFALPIVLPLSLSAQTAQDILEARENENYELNYGTNPFEDPDAAGALPPDSISRDKRMRRPLESYFFSDSIRALDNFSWTLDRNFNRVEIEPLDTTLNNWRIDYPNQKKGVGDLSLGALGQASMPINFFDRKRYDNFDFIQVFDAYTISADNVRFFNTKRPFTQMSYIEAGKRTMREVNFEIFHAQNISPSSGFNLHYKSASTRGQYYRQDTKNHNLSLAFSHTGKRYSVHAAYMHNKIINEENGGAVDIWTIRDSIFEMPSGVPTKLGDAEASNTYRNQSFLIEQTYAVPLQRVTEYDFSIAPLTAIYFGHSLEYSSWSKCYRDIYATYTNDRAYRDANGNFVSESYPTYDNWYINAEQSRDSIGERLFSNRFFVQAQPWDRDGVVGTLDGGIGVDLHTYTQFSMDDYVSGEMQSDNETSWFLYGKVSGKVKRHADWSANAEYYPTGYRGGDFSLGGDLSLKANLFSRPMILSGALSISEKEATYWQQNLFSNHYVWSNNFDKESLTRFDVRFMMPENNLELGFSQEVVKNKIYYDESSIVSQSSDAISVTGIYGRKDFVIGKKLHLDHRLMMQWTTDDVVIPLPDWSAYISYYYQFWAVQHVLQMQLGAECRITSTYYMPSYNPAISQFYNQREVELGNYPYMSLFAMAKWKRMRIFLKYEHINQNLYGNGEYFTTAYYPQNPGLFKIGISWGFYD